MQNEREESLLRPSFKKREKQWLASNTTAKSSENNFSAKCREKQETNIEAIIYVPP